MTYVLTITRRDDNPKYDLDSERSRRAFNYGNEMHEPPYTERQVLSMEVTPDQFEQIRVAALTVAA